MAEELEQIESSADNLRQEVAGDVESLASFLHGQISLYEDRANVFCNTLQARTKSVVQGISNVSQKLRNQQVHVDKKHSELRAECQALAAARRK